MMMMVMSLIKKMCIFVETCVMHSYVRRIAPWGHHDERSVYPIKVKRWACQVQLVMHVTSMMWMIIFGKIMFFFIYPAFLPCMAAFMHEKMAEAEKVLAVYVVAASAHIRHIMVIWVRAGKRWRIFSSTVSKSYDDGRMVKNGGHIV